MTDRAPSPFSTSEALRIGWRTTKSNLKPFLIIGAVGALLSLIGRALAAPSDGTALRAPLSIVIELLQVAVMLAYARAALRAYDGRPIGVDRPMDLVARFWMFLLTVFLYGLIVSAGLLLLVVPGVYWGLKFLFAPFLVVDRRLTAIEALRESSRLTRGVKWPLLGFALAAFGLNLVGALALGIGLIVTLPITYVAAVHILRRLQERAAERTAEAPVLHEPAPSA